MTAIYPTAESHPEMWPEGWDSDEPPADYELPPAEVVAEAVRTGKAYSIAAILPETFWERPVHQHIRQAAYSRSLAADAVFGVTLARLSSMLSPDLVLDFGLGPASGNLFVAVYGPAGGTKSSSARMADTLLVPPPYLTDYPDGIGIGSGEGIAEMFMGTVEIEEDIYAAQLAGRKKPKVKTIRQQVRHNAFLYVDEGATLIKLGVDRKGSILGEAIRSSWNGLTLGQANAREETTRMVRSGTYSLGMAVGFQRKPAEALIADAELGTPQRFLWVSAIDPRMPDDDVEYPGPLRPGITDDDGNPVTGLIHPPEHIRREVVSEAKARRRGEVEVTHMEEHTTLTRCKVAMLLAVLDQRIKVLDEDWELAGMVVACSNATRDRIVELQRQRQVIEAEMRDEEAATRAVTVQAALSTMDADMARMGDRISTKVREAGGLTFRQVSKLFDSKKRPLVQAALDLALKAGRIRTEDNVYRPDDYAE